MSKFKFIIAKEASEEIINSYAWYEKQKSGLGEDFLSDVGNCFDYIKGNPNGFEKKV